MKKESFIFYISQYEAIKELKDEQLGRVFRAIFEEQLEITEKQPQNRVVLTGAEKIAFNFINNQMVIDREKYIRKCETLKNNAKKGGAPIGNQNAKKKKQPKQSNREKNNLNDNEYVNDNDNEDDITTNNNLYECIEQNFGRILSPIEYETVSEWEDTELTRYAIKKAIMSNKCSIGYISGILQNFKRNNITTVQQAQDSEEQFKKRKEDYAKYKGLSYKEREYLKSQEVLDKYR